ncbi:hypothetical protein BV20DRAFT_1124273 [Pilatotrama ljubarskyi]|nr:hypothetical protein BV20DRAFT_1124273 [Pilatotrama ljubarskyi]
MPEYTEVLACYHTVWRWYRAVCSSCPLRLRHIWVDATISERKRLPASSPGRRGLPYILGPDSTIKRGSCSVQQYVWPRDQDGNPLESLENLQLQDVRRTPRTLVLDLGQLWFQVQLLTHCTAQPYTRAQWDEEVSQVSCIENARGFRVAIALDFEEYVLALLTADLLWTPHWITPGLENLRVRHIDVYTDYMGFLEAVAECLDAVASEGFHTRTALATSAVRDVYGHIFGGIGTYTVVELFFMAGLSVFLTEGELFACPSRLARLCEAFWEFAHQAHIKIPAFIEDAYVGYVLAPTQDHRKSFSHKLHVHAKKRVNVSSRMKALQKDYERVLSSHEQMVLDADSPACIPVMGLRDASAGLYDVFEPTYLRTALTDKSAAGGPVLGHLIFGDEDWMHLSEGSACPTTPDDPLTANYRELGLHRAHTNLRISAYDQGLFLSPQEMRASCLETKRYTCPTVVSQKALWSITSVIPVSLIPFSCWLPLSAQECLRRDDQSQVNVWAVECDRLFCEASAAELDKALFINIIKGRGVAIGPLEYCAIGLRVQRGGPNGKKNWQLAVCQGSPVLEEHFHRRQLAGIQKKKDGRHKLGFRKAASRRASGPGGWGTKPSTPVTDSRKRDAAALDDQVQNVGSSVAVLRDVDNGADIMPQKKKPRLSADRKVALDALAPPRKQKNQHKLCPPEDALKGPLTYYYTLGLMDAKIAELCRGHFDTAVYGLSGTTVKRMRKMWDLKKTRQQDHTLESIHPYALAIKSRFPQRGAQGLVYALRVTYNIQAPIQLVREWLNLVEPDAVKARRHRKFKRHRFWAAGVNDMWTFDQHDKWARFNLFLHGCVEPVAGQIKWLKIWWNNSNPRLITSYYLESARKLGAIPLITQSDPGTENFGVANAHTYIRHALDPSLADTLQHRWMRSHMNIKPEILWSILNRDWKPGFEATLQYGVDQGWYDPNNDLETFVFRWLAIPWLQAELDTWAAQFNSTPRRASKHKVLPHGIPDLIAQKPEDFNVRDFKIPVPSALLDAVAEEWAPANHPIFQCVPPDIEGRLVEALEALGRPVVTSDTFWVVYLQVLGRVLTPAGEHDGSANSVQLQLQASALSSAEQALVAEPIVLVPGLRELREGAPVVGEGGEQASAVLDAANMHATTGDGAAGKVTWNEVFGLFTDEEDDGEDPGFF